MQELVYVWAEPAIVDHPEFRAANPEKVLFISVDEIVKVHDLFDTDLTIIDVEAAFNDNIQNIVDTFLDCDNFLAVKAGFIENDCNANVDGLE